MNKYQGKVRRRRQNLLIVEGKHEKKSSKDERKYVIIRICQQLYFSDTLFS